MGGGSLKTPLAKCFLRQPIGIVMAKMILNAKFWFLAIHREQKKPPVMTFLPLEVEE